MLDDELNEELSDAERERQVVLNAERAEFWDNAFVPVDENWRENGTDFINPIDVADMFASSTRTASRLAQEAEVIVEKIAKLDFKKSELSKDTFKIRRAIFADNYNKITKSAGSEIQEAFVISMATDDQRVRLLAIEAQVDVLDTKIRKITPRLNKIRFRLKTLEKNLEWAKEYLNFDKMMTRINSGGR